MASINIWVAHHLGKGTYDHGIFFPDKRPLPVYLFTDEICEVYYWPETPIWLLQETHNVDAHDLKSPQSTQAQIIRQLLLERQVARSQGTVNLPGSKRKMGFGQEDSAAKALKSAAKLPRGARHLCKAPIVIHKMAAEHGQTEALAALKASLPTAKVPSATGGAALISSTTRAFHTNPGTQSSDQQTTSLTKTSDSALENSSTDSTEGRIRTDNDIKRQKAMLSTELDAYEKGAKLYVEAMTMKLRDEHLLKKEQQFAEARRSNARHRVLNWRKGVRTEDGSQGRLNGEFREEADRYEICFGQLRR